MAGYAPRRRVGSEGRGGVARRRAGHGADVGAPLHHLAHERDQDGHAEVLEGSCVRVAAELHPELAETELPPEAFRPEEVRAPLVHRDDAVFVRQSGQTHSFLPQTADP